jgi:hypothetical protein
MRPHRCGGTKAPAFPGPALLVRARSPDLLSGACRGAGRPAPTRCGPPGRRWSFVDTSQPMCQPVKVPVEMSRSAAGVTCGPCGMARNPRCRGSCAGASRFAPQLASTLTRRARCEDGTTTGSTFDTLSAQAFCFRRAHEPKASCADMTRRCRKPQRRCMTLRLCTLRPRLNSTSRFSRSYRLSGNTRRSPGCKRLPVFNAIVHQCTVLGKRLFDFFRRKLPFRLNKAASFTERANTLTENLLLEPIAFNIPKGGNSDNKCARGTKGECDIARPDQIVGVFLGVPAQQHRGNRGQQKDGCSKRESPSFQPLRIGMVLRERLIQALEKKRFLISSCHDYLRSITEFFLYITPEPRQAEKWAGL